MVLMQPLVHDIWW